jgi:hypothetical protein
VWTWWAEREGDQLAGGYVGRHGVERHAAPAQTGAQKFVLRAQIGDAPGGGGGDWVFWGEANICRAFEEFGAMPRGISPNGTILIET